jgi:2'-5' RNA ligase
VTTLRTFVAIELGEGLCDHLASLQDRLAGQLSPRSVRWVRPEAMHLTLKFLGNTRSQQVEAVKVALDRAVSQVPTFAVSVGGLGCFPNSRRPRVVWVGLYEPTGTLASLRDAVESHIAPLGFPTENRPFRPHLTLGRVQRRASKSEVREIGQVVEGTVIGELDEISVKEVSYIKSELKPSGAVYRILHEAQLRLA